jgi:tetratricopeptide (TPR) repeat protein
MKTGRFDESIDQYRKALKADPTFVASYTGIVSDQTYLGRYEKARKTADIAFENAVNDGQRRNACFLKCVTYVDQSELSMAVQQLERQMAIATANNDAGAIAADLTTIGMLQLESNQPDKAIASFKRSVEVVDQSDLAQEFKDNNRLNYLANEARVAVVKGEYEKAQALQSKFAAGAEKNGNQFQKWIAFEIAGLIAMNKGQYAEAVQEFLKSNQQNTYNLYHIAQCYEHMGDMEKAKDYYGRTAKFNQLANVNYSLVRHRANKRLTSL